jgi:hypothetical protein
VIPAALPGCALEWHYEVKAKMQASLQQKCPPTVIFAALAVAVLAPLGFALGADWQVGLARVQITPRAAMPMAGYGPRMSAGVLDDLHAKVIAISQPGGPRAVLVTADLLFFRAPVADSLARRIVEQTHLARTEILLCASHTHAGPVVGMTADLESFGVPKPLYPRVAEYTDWIERQVTAAVAAALADMQPARLSWGLGQADFVVNRRLKQAGGIVMAPNPRGPVDRGVPVLRIDDRHGRLRAVVFGCACHPATLDGGNRLLSGDYAGLAQQAIERRHPGVQAMFVLGCAGDANPNPRGSVECARRQAETLAAEVERVAAGRLTPAGGPLRVEAAWTDLPLEHDWTRAQWEKIAAGPSWWHARTAKAMLQRLDRGEPIPRSYRAPIAFWELGDGLVLVGLSGEPVCEYATRIRQRLGREFVWVAGCCHESFGYLPTPQILEEGGHESMGLTLATGLFAPQVEQAVLDAVEHMASKPIRPRIEHGPHADKQQ